MDAGDFTSICPGSAVCKAKALPLYYYSGALFSSFCILSMFVFVSENKTKKNVHFLPICNHTIQKSVPVLLN